MSEISFEKELETLINRYSKENDSNTPDFILCGYIQHSLHAFTTATRLRDNWYGGVQSPGQTREKTEKPQWETQLMPNVNQQPWIDSEDEGEE